MTAVFVFLGAAVGAPLRYLTDRTMQARHDTLFPWGTLTVNVLGSLALGVLAGVGSVLPGSWEALLGVGFCGAFTTYSTFSFETLRLAEERAYFFAAVNLIVSTVAGLGAALLGYAVSHAFVA